MREQLERPGTASRTITTAVWGWKGMRSVINSSVDRIQIESLPANQVIVAPTVFLPPLLLHLENPLALNKCFTLAGLASVYLYAVLRHRCCTLLIYSTAGPVRSTIPSVSYGCGNNARVYVLFVRSTSLCRFVPGEK